MIDIMILIGDILIKDGVRFRVIGRVQKIFSVICIDSQKLSITTHDADDIIKEFENGNIQIQHSKSEDRRVFNVSDWPEAMQETYHRNTLFVNKVISAYGPLFTDLMGRKKKTEFVDAYNAAGLSNSQAWLVIKQYLRSGFDPAALADQRVFKTKQNPYSYTKKTGRPSHSGLGIGVKLSEDALSNMEEARQYYLSGRAQSIKSAYEEMVRRHYTTMTEISNGIRYSILPQGEIPTYKQLYLYIKKNTDEKTIRIAKTSAQETRNAERLLLSDNLQGVTGPGSLFEIDECELDVSIVSEVNRSITVGRPILYAMVDVYSRMIVAVSIAFDNNSLIGVTSCLANLLENKQEYFARYGIEIAPGEIPSHIIPQRIRSDYGSEYISYELERIGRELGIQMELASPGTGSLKGQVEQLFRQIHAAQNPSLENKGLIERRHDSKHHKEATLTLEEITRMILATVAVHNRKYMSKYPLTRKMRAQNVNPTPVDLWKFGVENAGFPRTVINEDSFRYALLTPVKASISRAGLCFEDLYYINLQSKSFLKKMFSAGDKRIPFECRIDPRNVEELYYLEDGKLERAALNSQKTGMDEWKGISLTEYRSLRKEKLKNDREGAQANLQLDIALHDRHENIVREASKHKTVNVVSDLRENRKAEKQLVASKCGIVPHQNFDVYEEEAPIKDDSEKVAETLEEAIRMFEEDEDARYGK